MRSASRKLARQSIPIARTFIRQRVDALIPYSTNARTHSAKQIKALARSIREDGFVNPILVDANGVIIAGHGRYEAARDLALDEVPTIVIDHLTEAEQRAYRIADNRLAEVGTGWSIDRLKLEVDAILELDPAFYLDLTGFEARDLDLSFDTAASKMPISEPAVPERSTVAVTRIGDVWRIGDHQMTCGDATTPEAYRRVLGPSRGAMVIADAPYNVPISGHVTGNGKARHREFAQASGEMSSAEFQQFLLSFMLRCAQFSRSGALHYLFMDWRHLPELLAAATVAYDEYKNLCVWNKSNGGLGSLYRSQHELIAIFKKGTATHINNVELGKNGRNRSNVWSYAGMNSFGRDRDTALEMHPTVKPLALVRDAILDASNRDDLVLDPFGGSGTTLLAADAVRRRARLIELDPLYCDVILRRCQEALGVQAILAATGESFDAVVASREVPHG